MKRFLISLLIIAAWLPASAENYVIVTLSTETISIGGKPKKERDTFSDKDTIKWTLASQSMRIKCIGKKGKKPKCVTAQYMKDHKISTIAELDKLKDKTYDYGKQNIKNNHTSTRQAVRY